MEAYRGQWEAEDASQSRAAVFGFPRGGRWFSLGRAVLGAKIEA
jgi:hypothetical protein